MPELPDLNALTAPASLPAADPVLAAGEAAGPVVVVRWSGREASALRQAMRRSVSSFADFLGVSTRTVSKWEAREHPTVPGLECQGVLDTALQRATPEQRARFLFLLHDRTPIVVLAES